ncbi:MAG: phytase [Pseudomonadota bacterium]
MAKQRPLWGRLVRGLLTFVIAVAALAVSFEFAMQNPAVNGAVRCTVQETFYEQRWESPPPGTPVIEATAVTEPVRDACDAADDPAIWVHPSRPEESLIIGTNKQRSLNVYGLNGSLVDRRDNLGAPNNADIRTIAGRTIVAASDKDGAEIEVFELIDGTLLPLSGGPVPAKAEEELYGLCLYRTQQALFAFSTDKSGLIVQYRLGVDPTEGITATPVRELVLPSQIEGCAVDDAAGRLFVGEEDIGIWSFDASPDGASEGTLIARTGSDGVLTADVEGIAIYAPASSASNEGFLIASSQGNSSYAVFDRAPPHRFRGRFQLAFQGELIGDTDGLEVTAAPLGDRFPRGMLVVQDGYIRDAAGARRNQRFAMVSWADIETALSLQPD